MRPTVRYEVGLAGTFLSAANCYWLTIFPCVRRELRYWRTRAAEIPNAELRRLALESHQSKWCNVEGAAAFAIFAPPAYRQVAIRALVTFQRAYDYADTLAEQPAYDPVANGRLVHQPLAVALDQTARHPDYYAQGHASDDGGYLKDLTDTCRNAFHQLPSCTLVKDGLTRAAKRIITYQSLNHNGVPGHSLLAEWAKRETPEDSVLRWWEISASCASSLTALALLSAAAEPTLTTKHVTSIERAYHPWIGALHTLLDSLVDWDEDELSHQPSLLDNYESPCELTKRIQLLARSSRQATLALPQAKRHRVVLAGMAGLYLAMPEARSPRAQLVTKGVLDEMEDLMRPTLLVMRLRRAVRYVAKVRY